MPPTQQTKQENVHQIEDLASLKAISDPLRLRILLVFSDDAPRTVKEIAAELGVEPTRLYYHIRILEKAGMIRVASQRMVSGIEEKTYEATASSWVPSPSVTAMLGKSGFLKTLFKVVRSEVDLALRLRPGTEIGDADGALPLAMMTPLGLTTEQVEEVQNTLIDIQDRHSVDQEEFRGLPRYDMFCLIYRHPSELTESKQDTTIEEDTDERGS
jgi:DNA-binding transcriptional ArsR family regulator